MTPCDLWRSIIINYQSYMASATRGTVPSGVRIKSNGLFAASVRCNGAGTSSTFAGAQDARDFSLHVGDGTSYLGGTIKASSLDIVSPGITSSNALTSAFDSNQYALSNWMTRATQPGAWYAFIYLNELRRYVGIGLNVVQTSDDDGVTWTSHSSPGNRQWHRLAWAHDQRVLVAVAADHGANPIISSFDGGLTWTARSAGTAPIGAVAYGGGQFVALAVGDTNHYTSTDGITWTPRPIVRRLWSGLVWAETLRRFIAVSIDGPGQQAAVSEDGIVFSTLVTPVEGANVSAGWRAVAWSDSLQLFVAVAASGANGRIMTSSEGFTWTTRVAPSIGRWSDVIWAEEIGQFIVSARSLENQSIVGIPTISSSDGISWRTRAIYTDEGFGITWARNRLQAFMSVLPRTDRFDASVKTWARTTGVNTSGHLTWAPELGLVVATSGFNRIIQRSVNYGNSWTGVDVGTDISGLAWAPELNMFVTVSSSGTILYSTTGASSWASVNTSALDLRKVVWAPEIRTFVAVGGTSSGPVGYVARSTNGVNWTVATFNTLLEDVAWAPQIRRFVAVGSTGTRRFQWSVDGGITWTQYLFNWPQIRCVVWDAPRSLFYHTIAGDQRIFSSSNGESWTQQTSFSTMSNGAYSLMSVPELNALVAQGLDGECEFSTNGAQSWESVSRPTGHGYAQVWIAEIGRIIVGDHLGGISRMNFPRQLSNSYALVTSQDPSSDAEFGVSVAQRNVLAVRTSGISVRGTISSFTGCHFAQWMDARHALSSKLNGCIVSTTGTMATVSLDDSVPYVRLSSKARDPAVFGVLNVTDSGTLLVNSLGEGAVWVCDANGNLQNGDYVCASNLPGYAVRQNEAWVDAFTVAKVLFDVDFAAEPHVTEEPPHRLVVEVSAENPTTEHEEGPINEIITEGAAQTLKAEGADRQRRVSYMMRTARGTSYPVRHILLRDDGDVQLLLREEWLEKRALGEQTYVAAFVGCTYHCA